jgi:hypothetical protein
VFTVANQAMTYMALACIAMACMAMADTACASGAASQAVPNDGDDIGGVVAGPKGPEAGVWVIAETNDFATRFAKIVVTDDAGRYLVPDLPPAKYRVWVRGYGMVDSQPVAAAPGQTVNLTAVAAAGTNISCG